MQLDQAGHRGVLLRPLQSPPGSHLYSMTTGTHYICFAGVEYPANDHKMVLQLPVEYLGTAGAADGAAAGSNTTLIVVLPPSPGRPCAPDHHPTVGG